MNAEHTRPPRTTLPTTLDTYLHILDIIDVHIQQLRDELTDRLLQSVRQYQEAISLFGEVNQALRGGEADTHTADLLARQAQAHSTSADRDAATGRHQQQQLIGQQALRSVVANEMQQAIQRETALSRERF